MGSTAGAATDVVADVEIDLIRLMRLLKEARASKDSTVDISVDDDDGIKIDLHHAHIRKACQR